MTSLGSEDAAEAAVAEAAVAEAAVASLRASLAGRLSITPKKE